MRHPKNAEGKFWVNQHVCMACGACYIEAPTNIRYDPDVGMSYVYKQPQNKDELEQLKSVIRCCAPEAIEEGT